METEEKGCTPKLNNFASLIQAILDIAYERATTTGIPGLSAAADMAESYKDKHPGDVRKQADDLINRQIAIAAASGFVTGLGGFMTLPVTIPANLASVLYVQINMITAIAHLGGHDVRDNKVKTMVFACMVGNSVKNVLKEAGIVQATFVMKKLVSSLTADVIIRISRLVGFRLAAKLGIKEPTRLVPLVGGVIGGAIDAVWTKGVGEAAKKIFITDNI